MRYCMASCYLRDYYMTFSISTLVLAWDSHIKPDSKGGGLIWVDGWYQGPYGKFWCHNLFITYFTLTFSKHWHLSYMPTLERLKAVEGLVSAPPQKCFFQKDAKWCIMLHFGYTICSVKSLNINVVWQNHEKMDIFIQTLICWCLGIISSKCSASKLCFK
jgi:hypothetical protein